MAIKIYKPTTPGRRGMTGLTFEEVTKKKPKKSLTTILSKKSGRARNGQITVRRRGGGAKQKYRIIDFRQDKVDIVAKVLSIEYDPRRTSYIALVKYDDGEERYILAPQKLKVGQKIITSEKGDMKIGNRFRVKNIPFGTPIHNVEIYSGKGGQLVRTAGSSAAVIGKDEDGKYFHVRMPSGEVRKINAECMASIGALSKQEHFLEKIGKAGRSRWKGIRPHVRGKAMAPVAHPHGGGEGQNPIGLPTPKTPWGAPTLGKKTRKRKITDKMIIRSRKKKKRG
jgi:large subunit ribosomal protein L2